MDSNYIIKRLKTTPYKHYTVQLLRMRLKNLDEYHQQLLVLDLKTELHKQDNADIHEQLFELIHVKSIAA